jgi:outer membrane protein insertion porin family
MTALVGYMTKLYFFFIFAIAVLPGYPEELSNPKSVLFGKTIQRIDFEADLALDRSHFDPYLGIKPGAILTQTAVKEAIQFLYESGRFSEITVEAFSEGEGVSLRFSLRHNYYFNTFSIIGKVDRKSRSLWERLSLPIGQRFTDEKLEESRRAILKFLNERGFYLATATARPVMDDNTRRVNVVFEVNAGNLATIRSIEVTGVPSPESQAVLEEFGYKKGSRYDRSRLSSRVENLRKYFIKKGYLAAVPQIAEAFESGNETVGLKINVANFGRVRVAVQGFKIDRAELPKLLPALSGEGINPDTLEEGLNNLKDFLENKGYPEAEVTISETVDNSGVRVFRYGIVPSHKFTVASVSFKGCHAFTDQEMLASVQIQPAAFMQSTTYSAAHLDEDVASLKALYESRGYLEAKIIPLIEPLDNGNKLSITGTCEEGRISRVRSLSIHGNEAVELKELMSKIKLVPGAPYSPSLAEQDRQSLLSAYNDFGFLRAQVTVRVGAPDEAGAYPVEFQIQEGMRTTVDRIFVLGAERTRGSIIKKRIKLKSNEPLSLGRLLQTQQALYGLGIFDQVRVAPQNSESVAPYQDVVVRLQESNRFTMRYGFGYQEREKLRGTLEFSDLNVLGTARRAEIRLRGSSIEQQALFNLRQPQFRALPVESYFTFSFLHKRDVSFDSGRFNMSYQFSHPFSNNNWGMFRYNFKNVRLSNLQVSVSELGREDSPCNLSTFSGAFIRDSRDNHLDPTKGFFSSTDFGVTTKLLGSSDYVSFFSQNSYYRRLFKSFLMAGSIRLGLAHPYGGDTDLPISERYFAGGGSSLRGFETDFAGPLDPTTNNPVGGNALVIGSMEIRVPFFRFIHLAGFYDTGNVFRTISDVDFTGFSHTVGFGLRIKTPFGPVRADYGYNLNLSQDLRSRGLSRGHLFITIGPPF